MLPDINLYCHYTFKNQNGIIMEIKIVMEIRKSGGLGYHQWCKSMNAFLCAWQYFSLSFSAVFSFGVKIALPKKRARLYLSFSYSRQYNKLRNLVKDARHDCIVFANEFHQHSYMPREKGESMEKWQTRFVLTYAVLCQPTSWCYINTGIFSLHWVRESSHSFSA